MSAVCGLTCVSTRCKVSDKSRVGRGDEEGRHRAAVVQDAGVCSLQVGLCGCKQGICQGIKGLGFRGLQVSSRCRTEYAGVGGLQVDL